MHPLVPCVMGVNLEICRRLQDDNLELLDETIVSPR
jgi:hypothetical protein